MRIFQSIVLLSTMTVLAIAAEPLQGDWSAEIRVRDLDMRLVLHVSESNKGLQATFDSVDQEVFGLPVDKVVLKGEQFSFEIAVIQATYTGTLSKTGTEITGAWYQIGMTFPLNFRKTTPAKK